MSAELAGKRVAILAEAVVPVLPIVGGGRGGQDRRQWPR